ncbi:hypothetical protein RchiOBHm_Chr4g0392631 [Rosa chinensis]|uniref:Uncharacterized protein n=1 Tax=Rosa chinensis TaxID=74649 RepID=A0A2P6QQT2_ROSCH|nr:hypothetical protein RchiOBHm_Chr4g0392631 [Rosa chinensis]
MSSIMVRWSWGLVRRLVCSWRLLVWSRRWDKLSFRLVLVLRVLRWRVSRIVTSSWCWLVLRWWFGDNRRWQSR